MSHVAAGIQSWWLSGHTLGEDKEFKWMSHGREFGPYTNWNSTQPDNFRENEYCSHIWAKAYPLWNDNVCTKNYSVVCQQEP
jgi:hypothetical protein